MGKTRPKELLRRHITEMIEDCFPAAKSSADKWYKEFGLSPEEIKNMGIDYHETRIER